jgi:hypothetical protein
VEQDIKSHLSSRRFWTRALYMVIFAVAYNVAELIIVVLVLLQFFTVLLTGRHNARLLEFGNNLSSYAYQVLQFMTFNSEFKPFPFASWPDEGVGSGWVDDQEAERAAPWAAEPIDENDGGSEPGNPVVDEP